MITSKCGIYCILNTITNKVYIGSSENISKRWYVHRRDLNNGIREKHNPYMQHAWNKYGESAFSFQVLEYCQTNELREREQWWLDLTKCYEEEIGYNISRFAYAPMRGRNMSEGSRRKISSSMKGITRTITHQENNTLANSELWEIIDISGKVIIIRNLAKFCRDNGLSHGSMHQVAYGKRIQHKGWRVRKYNGDQGLTEGNTPDCKR